MLNFYIKSFNVCLTALLFLLLPATRVWGLRMSPVFNFKTAHDAAPKIIQNYALIISNI